MFPTYTQHTEGELLVFCTEERGREEYSSRVRVNPVRFLLIPSILKVSFSLSVQRREEERNIPAESELIHTFPTYTQHTEGELLVFHTKERLSEEYSSRIRVNPVCFLLILNILKVSFLFSMQRREEVRNIPAESELTQYVSYLNSRY
jgi:hypothetical protein